MRAGGGGRGAGFCPLWSPSQSYPLCLQIIPATENIYSNFKLPLAPLCPLCKQMGGGPLKSSGLAFLTKQKPFFGLSHSVI